MRCLRSLGFGIVVAQRSLFSSTSAERRSVRTKMQTGFFFLDAAGDLRNEIPKIKGVRTRKQELHIPASQS